MPCLPKALSLKSQCGIVTEHGIGKNVKCFVPPARGNNLLFPLPLRCERVIDPDFRPRCDNCAVSSHIFYYVSR